MILKLLYTQPETENEKKFVSNPTLKFKKSSRVMVNA